MAHNQDNLCAGRSAGKLQTADQIVIRDVSGDARVEGLADFRVEDDFGWRARIDAAQDRRAWILSRSGCALLRQVIMREHFAAAKPIVALLQQVDNVVGRKLVSLLLAEEGGEGKAWRGEAGRRQRSHGERRLQNGPATAAAGFSRRLAAQFSGHDPERPWRWPVSRKNASARAAAQEPANQPCGKTTALSRRRVARRCRRRRRIVPLSKVLRFPACAARFAALSRAAASLSLTRCDFESRPHAVAHMAGLVAQEEIGPWLQIECQ